MQSTDPKRYRYVLITPARDEAAYIRKTLESVVAQTVLPLKWVIVSDGSTDGTDQIIKEYIAKYDWIQLLRMPERRERHFAGKVRAFAAGYDLIKCLEFDVVGNVDADTSFQPDYLEYLLEKFALNPRLGVAGTNYLEASWDSSLKHNYRFSNVEDVSGGCQLFRRSCFHAIGGYQPSKIGGIDLIATISARMYGWQTRAYNEKILHHHRQQGTAEHHKYIVEFFNGRKDYMFGSHPLFASCRAVYRITKKPVFIGGLLLLTGYLWAMATRTPKTVSTRLTQFRRKEQMNRLSRILTNLLFPQPATKDLGFMKADLRTGRDC